MTQNVLMASMYFFIPLKGVDADEVKRLDFQEKKYDGNYLYLTCSLFTAPLEESGLFACYYKDVTNHFVQRRVRLNAAMLKYQHNPDAQPSYFLAVGTSVDKVFEDETAKDTFAADHLLTKNGLIKLKWTFESTGKYGNREFYGEKLGLFLLEDGKTETLTHVEWVEDILARHRMEAESEEYFRYAVTDICGVRMDAETTSMAELNQRFREAYHQDKVESYSEVLGEDSDRFAYGVIHSDDHYLPYTDSTIEDFLRTSYYLKGFERLYASPKGIVTLKTHCPYKNPEKWDPCLLNHSFQDVFNTKEFCHVLYIVQEVNHVMELLSSKKDSSEIREDLLKPMITIREDVFHLVAAEQRLNVIYMGMGVQKSIKDIQKIAEQKAKSLDTKESEKRDASTRRLSYLSLVLVSLQSILTIWGMLCIPDKNAEVQTHVVIILLICSLLLFFSIASIIFFVYEDNHNKKIINSKS